MRISNCKHGLAANAELYVVVAPCSLARRRADELEMVRRRLGPAPDDDCREATTRIRIRLLSGTQVQRRFLASNSLQALFDFVDTSAAQSSGIEAEVAEPTPYVLRLQFPATEFARPSSVVEAPTLEALGLCPNALLLAEEQAMAEARTADQVVLTSAPRGHTGVHHPSDQITAAAAADEGGWSKSARKDPKRPASIAGDISRGNCKRKHVTTTDVSHHEDSKPADVVDLLSSDDEGGESAASVTATTACWTCNVCTYAGNSAAAQRCQICGNSRD